MPNRLVVSNLTWRALAEPTRRAMVERLSAGSASVSELAAPVAMSMPAVLQHLKVLEDGGLVRSTKTGRVRTYRLEPTALRPVEQWINDRQRSWDRRLDRLGQLLAETED